MTQFDEASIAKLKVVELKQELEKLNVDIPKGAKKADLAALLRSVTIEAVKEEHDSLEEANDDLEGDMDDLEADLKAVKEEETASLETENKASSESAPDTKVEEKQVNGKSVQEVKAESEEKVHKADVKPERDIDPPAESGDGSIELHADTADLDAEKKDEEEKRDTEIGDPPVPKDFGDVRGESPELAPPPVKKRRENPSHDSNRSAYRHSEPRRRSDYREKSPHRRAVRMEHDPSWDDSRVQISPYMADLNIKITESNRCENLNYEGLGYCYAGAKATHGVRGGKVCFEIHISREMPTKHLHPDEKSLYWCRVGWSTGMSDLNLGEDQGSIGFDSHAKLAYNKKFMEYGSTFRRGDTIGCFLDLTDPKLITVAYTRNGKQQLTDDGAETVTYNREELGCAEQSAFYPHFLIKNYSVHLHFGRRSSTYNDMWESSPKALRDYTLIGAVPVEERIAGPKESEDKRNCSVIMMCGLPSSGKTTWVDKFMNDNRAKHFHMIGNESIMDKMSICGEKREKYSNKYGTPFEELQSKVMGSVLRIMERANRKKRNYILDQANIYRNGHVKKMGPFEGFHRRCIVVVPSDEEYERRKQKKQSEGGRKITNENMMKWKAAMSLPEKDDNLFEKIEYLDLQEEEAKKLVAKYNEEGDAFKKIQDEKYGRSTDDRDRRSDSRTSRSREVYSNPPPVLYSNSLPGGDQNAQQWQDYYKKYFECYGQYPSSAPPPVVQQTYSSGNGTAAQWQQYHQQYQQYYQQYQQFYQTAQNQQPPPSK